MNGLKVATGTVVGALVGALLRSPLAAQPPAVSDSTLRAIAAQVAALDLRRQWAGATAATVDSLLAYYSDSVVYEHPSVGAVVRGKSALRAGMLRFIGSAPERPSEVPGIVIGPGVAMLAMPARPDPRAPARAIPPERRALRVLEFDGEGRIRRILDYPW